MTPTRNPAVTDLAELRARRPEAVREAASARTRRPVLGEDGRLLLVAADHPARGALGVRASTASSPRPTCSRTSCCSGTSRTRW
jgi:hypothetical protein